MSHTWIILSHNSHHSSPGPFRLTAGNADLAVLEVSPQVESTRVEIGTLSLMFGFYWPYLNKPDGNMFLKARK